METETFTVNSTTAIDELNDINIRIYPIPVSDILHIESDIDLFYTEIYNLYGVLIQKQDFQVQTDVSHLKNGIYFVKLYGKDNELVAIKKLMVHYNCRLLYKFCHSLIN